MMYYLIVHWKHIILTNITAINSIKNKNATLTGVAIAGNVEV